MRSALETTISQNFSRKTLQHVLLGTVLVLVLGACSSQSAREAEMAAAAAEQAALDQEAARVAQEQERQRAAEAQRRREAEAAEQARLQAQRDRQAEEARMRAEAEQRQRDAAERRERARLAAIAAAETERQEKLERIAELEAQIAALQAQTRRDESSAVLLSEAVQVAEQLLEVLTAEQAKYESTDASGNTTEPLDKELIAELQERKDSLVRRAAQ